MISKTFIGSAFHQGTALSTLSLPSYNQPAGECIVVLTQTYEGAGSSALGTITDTAGNTYVAQLSIGGGQGLSSGNSNFLQVWVAKNCLGNASNVITLNYAGGDTFSSAAAYHCGGADLTSPVDVLVTNSGSSSSAASASYTTATADEALLFLLGTVSGFIKANSVNSSFTLDAGEIGGSGAGLSAVASKLVSSIQTSQTVTFTLNSSTGWNTLLISIKEAAAVGSSRKPVVCVMQ